MHYGSIHSIKDFLELQKVKVQILLNFDRNHMKLFGTGEELPKDSGEIISVKYLSKVRYLWTKSMIKKQLTLKSF